MPTPARRAADPASHLGGDVLVIGGGPAGLATAIELRSATGLRVVVAEARMSPTEQFGETLTPGCLAALDRLGVADAFRADGHLACPGGISSWGRDLPGHSDHILDPGGPAWHIDRARFEARLRARATEVGAEVRAGTRAIDSRGGAGRRAVLLRDLSGAVSVIEPAWVVDATGRRSWYARRSGARRLQTDRMVAIFRFARVEAGIFTAQTVVEATPDGWWYAARLPGSRLVTAMVADPSTTGDLLGEDGRLWSRALMDTVLLEPLVGRCRIRAEPLVCRTVGVSILDRVSGPGWLAVGDAASERDPITGTGIHDALLDGADAARSIVGEIGSGEVPPWRYGDRVRARFERHLATRDALYAAERRWSDQPFWRRRVRQFGR